MCVMIIVYVEPFCLDFTQYRFGWGINTYVYLKILKMFLQSILYSRSEFVVAELTQLQVKLKELDKKAGLIELDLRNAMEQGKQFCYCK